MKHRLLIFWLILTLLVGTGSLYAAEEDPQEPAESLTEMQEEPEPEAPGPVFAENITLDPQTLEMHIGDRQQIQATLTPPEAVDDLDWTSSDESVAFVSQDGTVTAVGAGTTTITAHGETAEGTMTVTVLAQKVESITLSTTSLQVPKGKKSSLQAIIAPDDAENQDVIWSSSDTTIATIDSIGQITAKKAGKVQITAVAADGSGATATCTVEVIVPATKVVLNATKGTKGVKETFTLKPTLTPADSTDAVKWSSSDKAIATVSKAGKVTPKKAGTCTITVKTDSGKKATYKLTVKKAPKSITLNKTKKTLNIKSKYTLKATLSSGSAGAITWTSSKPTVASVSKKGVVTAKKAGKTTITAETYNGKKATCTVTVRPNAKKIKFEKSSITLGKNKSQVLKLIYTPSDSKEAVTYKSSDTKVAKVNSKGKVTAVSVGTCTITAETKYTHKKATCTVKVRSKMIALTFDDGPSRATTPRLLDGLKKNGAHCTFFMVGQNISGNEDIVKRMKNEGHELGNHTWSHDQLTTLSTSGIYSQVSRQKEAVKKACGSYPTVFRAPYGSFNSTVLNAIGVPNIYWSVDTLDWKYRDSNYVYNEIVDSAYEGAIILCHDIHPTTVDGALKAVAELQRRGYEFVTVTELLGSPKAGTTYYSGK